MKKRYELLALFLVFVVLFSACGSPVALQPEPTDQPTNQVDDSLARALPANVADGAILHAYNWRFADIQSNLSQIAAAGYKAVQVSPVQGTKATGEWWLLYQPTNFAIGNAQLGTQSQFQSLCSAANGYGIKIIVDAVLNHVADNGTSGVWANEVESYLKRSDWYHNQGTISNYTDRRQLTQGNLGNLPDLATQRSDVQQTILSFLNSCVSSGAGGFRFDAAKHIETNIGLDSGQTWAGTFWTNVLGGLSNRSNLYLYGEVIQDTGDNAASYQSYFDITAHGYIWTLSNAFNNGNWSGIQSVNGVPADKALVYMENHDTYEHNETKSFSFAKRKAMWAVITARSAMTPLFLVRPGTSEWKDGDIVALNNFRNAMVGQSEYMRFPAAPVLAIERGTKGMVIINNGAARSISFATNLAAGTYSNKGLASASVTVSGGTLSGNLPGYSVLIFNGTSTSPTPTPPPSGTTTTIKVNYDVGLGNSMFLRGSVSPLNWTTGVAATWTTGNVWVYSTTAIPSGTAFEFKALINDSRWSDGANFTGTGGQTITITPTYNGNFYDIMDTISTNWAISGGTTSYKWYQGSGCAQARATSTISYLTQKYAMNKTGTVVTLAFKYKTVGLDTGEYLKVQVLKGTTWTNVGTYTGTKDWTNTSINITAYQSTAMKLRFLSYMSGTDEYVYVDNVAVSKR